MAITVTELIESRQFGLDRNGKKIATRVYRADAPPDAVIIGLPGGLPKPGDQFPTDGTLECDNVAADYWPGSVGESKFTATYTTDKSGTFGGSGNPSDPGYSAWSISYKIEEVVIPYFVWNENAYSYVANGTTVNVSAWVTNEMRAAERRTVYMRRVILTALTPTIIAQIDAQQDKLHKIGAQWLLFQAGDIEVVAANRWGVTYSWLSDVGTPDTGSSPSSDVVFPTGLACAIAGMYPGITYTRPPFHRDVVVPGATPTDLPAVFADTRLQAVPTGYTSLPGWT